MDFSANGMAGNRSLLKTFRDGLYTQLSNPKTALVFASIFTALLPTQIPTAFYYIVPLMSFLIDVSWYSLVALVLSADRPRRVYLRLKRQNRYRHCDGAGALGLRLYRHLPHPLAATRYGYGYRVLKGNAIFATNILLHHQHIDIAARGITTNRATAGILSGGQADDNFAALLNHRFLKLVVGIVKAGQA